MNAARAVLFLSASMLTLVGVALAAAQTVPPTPTPAVANLLCRGEQKGEQTVPVGGGTRVSLPSGTFDTYLAPPTGDSPWFEVCHVESGGSRIRIELYTCREIARDVRQPEGSAVLDRILQSCSAPPTPIPWTFCGESIPNRSFTTAQGPRDLIIDGRIIVKLASGSFELSYEERSGNGVRLCNPVEQYSVTLSFSDCSELSAAAVELEDIDTARAIGRTCILLATASPTTSPTAIQPPSVGDAGLALRN
jgi:hypothetical protein